MSEQTGSLPPGKGGKKILGLPRPVVIFGGIALAAGVLWYLYKRRQSAASGTSATGTDTSGTDYAGELSTLQSEYGDLASQLAAMQGGGGSSGGVTPGGGTDGGTADGGTGDGSTAGGSTPAATGTPAKKVTPIARRKPPPKPGKDRRPRMPGEEPGESFTTERREEDRENRRRRKPVRRGRVAGKKAA